MKWQYQYVILPIDTSFNFVLLYGPNGFAVILNSDLFCLKIPNWFDINIWNLSSMMSWV